MSKILIWYGELTTKGSLLKRGLLFLTPGVAWLVVFLIVPGLALIAVSFASRGT